VDKVVQIPLRARSGEIRAYALVDAEGAAGVLAYRWSLSAHGYVVRATPRSEGKRIILLHRQLLGLVPGDGVEGDHINGDKLDNRLRNLRRASRNANAQNKNFCNAGTSRFRGVSWVRSRGVWRADACGGYLRKYLGLFKSELAAAQAAETWRQEHMPFANPDPELLKYYEERAL
jgi:hypothetical protein